jgi:hypothetical protein
LTLLFIIVYLNEEVSGKERGGSFFALSSQFLQDNRRTTLSQRNGFVHAEAAGEETETAVTSSSYSGV